MNTTTLLQLSIAVAATATLGYAQSACDQVKALALPNVTFTTIESIAAGPYRAPAQNADGGGVAPGRAGAARGGAPAAAGRGGAGRGPAAPPLILPAYCRVAATLKPSADSDIRMEVWLPENWNGKIEMVGNGGWAGVISYAAMAAAVKEGYASTSTDTGHEGGNGMFALGHPEKIVDFGYRAVHDTLVTAKAVSASYYGKGPKYSYWNGCSTGGRQALVEVTRYPEDFDGVVAGAPANPHLHLHASSVERSMEEMKLPKDAALSTAKIETLHKAVMAQCDARDGVKDGLIGDPLKCKFDPSVLLCKGADSDACLTAPQVELAKVVYADVKTKKGETIWTGFEPGGELQYASMRNIPAQPGGGLDSIRILGYQNADWDWRMFDLDRDVAMADEKAGFIDAHTYDLSPFKAHGGKLLLYHGWADQAIPPGNTINFYKGVLAKMGAKQDDWMKLYMVPGMMHCQGGDGPDQFNKMAVVERWREAGTAPKEIVASHVSGGQVDRTRPLCAYPQVAVYKGAGSTNDASSFTCKLP
jgi:feruloyl esterase